MNTVAAPASPDLLAVKVKQQATWSSGNYASVGSTLQIVGENLAEAMDLRPDMRVLDVAAGNGNATLAAARRGCNVVSTDYVPALLQNGKARAEAEGFDVRFREADAENLPFEDSAFDAVMSTFGVMFTANQEKAAQEMLRVTRRGARIGMANWTPQSFIGDVFRTIGTHVPPPTGVPSPLLWGTADHIRELFGPSASRIEFNKRHFMFRLRSPEYWVEHWREVYGPTHKAFQVVGPEGAEALAADLVSKARAHSLDQTAMIVPAEYAEIVIYRS